MNVILMISDTVRHDYCGCYGNTWVQTPNIDALASESAIMENFFSASFPTGPMRKDVHTGRFTFTYTNWQGPRVEGEEVLSEILSAEGYRTAFIGDTGNSEQIKAEFDYKEIIPGRASKIDEIPEEVELPADPRKLRVPMNRIQNIVRNALGWDGEEDRRVARTMRAAHKWLEEQHGSETPFFLFVDTFDPHEPWDQPNYYTELYDPDYQGDELMEPAYEPAAYTNQSEIQHMCCMYAGKLTMVDRWIGYLLDGVEKMGLAGDTAIIFTSDHGFYHGEHNLIGKVLLDRDGAICGRWPLYSTIAHPPLLIRVPGVTDGQRHDSFCQPPDIKPTILDLLNAPVPSRVQGESLLPLIRRERQSIRDFAISSLTYVQDEEVRCPASFRTKDFLYIYGGDEWSSELYNLQSDPEEKQNIIDSRADVAEQLHQQYLGCLEKLNCPKMSLDARREFNTTPRSSVPYRKLL
ncbi:sulfatase [Candidatus Poribacteria bacterium]